jgi:hypothetical protein
VLPLLHALAGASTTPATGCGPCLVALNEHVGSIVTDQLLHTMALTPPSTVTDWVVDSGAYNHTTSDASNLTSVRPPTSIDPSFIIVGNGSALPITSVGDSTLPGPFYLNNVLGTAEIIQNLLFVHRFTTDNWCSIQFDLFGLSLNDLFLRGT